MTRPGPARRVQLVGGHPPQPRDHGGRARAQPARHRSSIAPGTSDPSADAAARTPARAGSSGRRHRSRSRPRTFPVSLDLDLSVESERGGVKARTPAEVPLDAGTRITAAAVPRRRSSSTRSCAQAPSTPAPHAAARSSASAVLQPVPTARTPRACTPPALLQHPRHRRRRRFHAEYPTLLASSG